jgi:serine/threonine protein kinase/tetratricopeptide (TPR) repeat protein
LSLNIFEDEDLPALIAVALELRDQGIEPPLEEICRKRPDLLEPLKDSLDLSGQLPDLQRLSAGHDRLAGAVLTKRYRLDSRLGSGAMGVVYKAYDLELNRVVAVKIMRMAMGDEYDGETRFAREAEVLAAIRHGAVVNIYDRGRTAEDDPFLVMEYVDGISLSQLLVEIKSPAIDGGGKDTQLIARVLGIDSIGEPSYIRAIVRWVADLANGVDLAHREGILHRDIKPSNILIKRSAEPVLIDFGIASQTSQDTLSCEGELVGTPAFMAPESIDGKTQPSQALDIYGLTATLYQLLTLRPPYSGTPTQVLAALSCTDPVPAKRLGVDLPADLLAILDRGMARRPTDRYETMADLESDLRAFLDYRPVQARPLTAVTRMWRRVSHSTAWRTGLAVAGVTLFLAVSLQARSLWQEKRAADYQEVWGQLPPNLGISGVETRQLTVEEGRAKVAQMLDDAVAFSDELLPARLIRAMFEVDHGRLEEAAVDMEFIGKTLGSPYSMAIAERYRALANEGVGTVIDTSELPEPEGKFDSYLAGIHALRSRDIPQARNQLSDPRLSEFVPAQELLTLIMEDRSEQLERGMWLEERIGSRTAVTANLIGIALLLKQDYRAAYRAFEEGLELAPKSYGLQMNAARAAWMMDRREVAREHYQQIIKCRPKTARGHEMYIRFLMDIGNPTEAQSALEGAPFDDQPALYLELQGSIETVIALTHLSRGATEEALDAALRATDHFESARDLGSHVDSFYSRISAGIAEEDPDPVFTALIASLEKQPTNSRRLELLDRLIPQDLDEHQTELMRQLVASLREAFVSGGFSEASR